MGYIDDFLKEDDEDDLDHWLQSQTQDAPAYQRPTPDMMFTPEEAENAPDMTIGLDEAARGPAPFKPDMEFAPQWIETHPPESKQPFEPDMTISLDEAEGRTPGAATTQDSSPPFSDADKKSIGRRFDQEAFSDMRQNAMRHGAGFNGDDAALGGLAAALDLMFNKGRDLGGIASGIGQGVVARQSANNKKIGELADASIGMAKEDRAVANDASRNAYYQHERDMEDKRYAQGEKRYAEGAPLRTATTESAQADATMKALDALFAQEHGGFTPSEYSVNRRADAQVAHQHEREGVEDNFKKADDVRADKHDAAAAALAAATAAESKRKTTATEARTFNHDAGDTIDLAQQLKQLQPLIDKYTTNETGADGAEHSSVDMPGIDPLMALVPDFARNTVNSGLDYLNDNTDASEVAQLRAAMNAAFVHKISGAQSTDQEQKRLAIVNGTSPGASDAQFQVALKHAKELIPLMLAQQGSGREDAAALSLRNAGLGEYASPGAPEVQPPATAGRVGKDPALALPTNTTTPGPSQNQPAIRLGGGQLGAPSGGRAGLVGTDNGDGTVTVRFPDGSSGKYSIDDPRLKKKGVLIQ